MSHRHAGRRCYTRSSTHPAVAEAVPEFTHSRSHPLICFIGFEDGALTHLALGQRGVRAGTGLRRLNLEDLTPLKASVRPEDVLAKIPIV